ncbi:hypothetical protein V496_01702 [Pseudogymnoascus sp. VKM F-4515 (FW-2607)]|nr:hypothetical protein V496_01702 [Pseudogymnoascus sp. VKM F-4515 (FW-2607)]
MQGGMGAPYGQQGPAHEEVPTRVVGSQGRRGILPSAPGRPSVAATGPGARKNVTAKDADGKFPCPHCVKTYVHAKHLKRHLLRHTGDRPYLCVLCRDTFSRSDILKRHFQKCSIRRGNPTGASHLSHVKKNHQNALPAATKETIRNMNISDGVPNDPDLQPSNLKANRRVLGGQRTNPNDDQLPQGHVYEASSTMGETPSTMASMNPQLAAYLDLNGHHGLSNGHSGQKYSHQGHTRGQNGQ